MDVFVLNEQPNIAEHYIADLRDIDRQRDSSRFRFNMERIGELLAYELSKKLPTRPSQIITPLDAATASLIDSPLVIATILRAGLPLYQGMLRMFDWAESAFIGAYRASHHADEAVKINMEYLAGPELTGKILIIADPMLATGKSLVESYQGLIKNGGEPSQVHIVSAIASQPGVDYIQQSIDNVSIWTGALDPILDARSYIVPGLGDAGDLSFGQKK